MDDMKRRQFLQILAASGAALGLGAFSKSAAGAEDLPIGLQLYTLRQEMAADFTGTLKKAREIGYRHFEFAGYGSLSAADLQAFLKEIGADACGTHEGAQNFAKDAAAVIEFNKVLGNHYIVVPSMPRNVIGEGVEGIKGFARELNRYGEQAKKAGLQLCYHNHSFEFQKQDNGQTIWEILFTEADADLVKAEVDIAWVYNAGVDPIAHLEEWSDRVKLLHMKDIDSEKKLAPVGTGVIDLAAVVKTAKEIGVDWFIVEQDMARAGKAPLDEIAISFKNISALLG